MTRRPKRATTFVLNGDLPGPECTVLPRRRIQAPTRQAEALATLAKCRRLSSGAVPLCTVFIFKRGHPARSSCEPAAGRASRSLETPVQVQGLPAAEQSTQRDGWGRGAAAACSGVPGATAWQGGGRRVCRRMLPATAGGPQDPGPERRPHQPGAHPLPVGQTLHVHLQTPTTPQGAAIPCYRRGSRGTEVERPGTRLGSGRGGVNPSLAPTPASSTTRRDLLSEHVGPKRRAPGGTAEAAGPDFLEGHPQGRET